MQSQVKYNAICPTTSCGKRWIETGRNDAWIDVKPCLSCQADYFNTVNCRKVTKSKKCSDGKVRLVREVTYT